MELFSSPGYGGLHYAFEMMEKSLANAAARPVFVVEAREAKEHIYAPALSAPLRQAMSERRLLWLKASAAQLPQLTQMLLESGLLSMVLLTGVDHFARNAPASLWTRRWQLAAERGGTELLWWHARRHAVLGVGTRIEWAAVGQPAIVKGKAEGKIYGRTQHPAA